MDKAINGNGCEANQIMHRLQFRVTQLDGVETTCEKAAALEGSFRYAWKLFMHLGCVKNPNFQRVLEAVTFKRLSALIENRTTLLDIISTSASCWFHDGLCTPEDLQYAKRCIECLFLTENPCGFVEHIKYDGSQPTFTSAVIDSIASDVLNFDW